VAFLQIIELRTKDPEQLEALSDEFFRATEGKRTLRRSIVTQDRNDPDRFMVLAFFDSYESAMENSNLPETAALAEKHMSLLDARPTFYDLDIIDDRT
jgi:quinol monooxygenase YgiN